MSHESVAIAAIDAYTAALAECSLDAATRAYMADQCRLQRRCLAGVHNEKFYSPVEDHPVARVSPSSAATAAAGGCPPVTPVAGPVPPPLVPPPSPVDPTAVFAGG